MSMFVSVKSAMEAGYELCSLASDGILVRQVTPAGQRIYGWVACAGAGEQSSASEPQDEQRRGTAGSFWFPPL